MNIQDVARFRSGQLLLILALVCWSVSVTSDLSAQTSVYAKQGYSMRLCFRNSGTMGRICYPGINISYDSIGLEYPLGSPYEHILGAGLWVGGLLDTARIGTSAPIRLVSTAYAGVYGPIQEFSPGFSPADTIWKVVGRGLPRLPEWETYWGNTVPRVSISDNDHYCWYRDDLVSAGPHVPQRLKVVQNSYVWNDPYAEAVHIIEYKIINMGEKRIDSAYVGIMLQHYVGPYTDLRFERNVVGYYTDLRSVYVFDPVNVGPTPVGIVLLEAIRPLDSLRLTFRWWSYPQTPTPDLQRYLAMSAGTVMPNQDPPGLIGDYGGLLSCGPFTIRPGTDPHPDTVVAAFGIVSGQNLSFLRQHAERAKLIYQSGGQVGVEESAETTPASFELLQNYPNPFNASTRIGFETQVSGFTLLKVYDVLGREVAALVNETKLPGRHEVTWNAADMPSGVYLVRLTAGSQSATRRILLLR